MPCLRHCDFVTCKQVKLVKKKAYIKIGDFVTCKQVKLVKKKAYIKIGSNSIRECHIRAPEYSIPNGTNVF